MREEDSAEERRKSVTLVCMYVCVCVCVRARARACVCVCIPLSVRTRLLELLCVFNCSPYFSSCGTEGDLHLCVGEWGERGRERERETANEAPVV